MVRFLLRNFFFLFCLAACTPGLRTSNNHVSANSDHSVYPVDLATPIADTIAGNQADSLSTSKPLSLMDLPQTEDGQIVLSEGFYEADFKSYCLQPGTPSPADGDAYSQAPLGGYRKDIIETILRNSLKQPDLDQRNIQLLLWSVVSGSDFRRLSWQVQSTAKQLLSRKQVFQLKGGVMGVVKEVSEVLPETGVSTANYKLKQLFELGNSSYELFERIAVLRQTSEARPAVQISKDQWYKQPGGYYLRYFPNGYQRVKVQVYVPKGATDFQNNSGDYLLFDPVTVMAIPANSNSQRLGIGAPVINIVRTIINLQKIPPSPAPKRPPVKTNNPKGIRS